MKKTIIFFTIISIQTVVFSTISLEEAIQNGIKINRNHQNQIHEEKIRQITKKSTEMKRFFTIHTGLSYLYRSDQMEIVFPERNLGQGIFIPGEKIAAGAKHNYDLNMSIVQPIFAGNILSNSVKTEEIRMAIEKNKTFLNKISIITSIKTSYFNYRMLINEKRSLHTLIDKLNLHHKKIKNFYREELAKKSDLLETEARIQEQHIHLEDLNHLIQKEKINFKALTGMNIEDISEGYSEKIGDYQTALTNFKTSHPVIKSLNNQMALISTKKRILAGKYLPQISGFAELHYGKPGIDFFKNEWSLYFQGGININLKTFNWNQKSRDTEILDHSITKIKNQKEDYILNGKKYLDQLYNAKQSTESKLKIVNHLIRLSKEDIELKERLLKEQQISNIDYLTSLTSKERFISMNNKVQATLQLIKVNINKIAGNNQEEK